MQGHAGCSTDVASSLLCAREQGQRVLAQRGGCNETSTEGAIKDQVQRHCLERESVQHTVQRHFANTLKCVERERVQAVTGSWSHTPKTRQVTDSKDTAVECATKDTAVGPYQTQEGDGRGRGGSKETAVSLRECLRTRFLRMSFSR